MEETLHSTAGCTQGGDPHGSWPLAVGNTGGRPGSWLGGYVNRCTITALIRLASFKVWLLSASSLFGKVVMRIKLVVAMAGQPGIHNEESDVADPVAVVKFLHQPPTICKPNLDVCVSQKPTLHPPGTAEGLVVSTKTHPEKGTWLSTFDPKVPTLAVACWDDCLCHGGDYCGTYIWDLVNAMTFTENTVSHPLIPVSATCFLINSLPERLKNVEHGLTGKLSLRKQRFMQFSSLEHEGEYYMTPRDFLFSVMFEQIERKFDCIRNLKDIYPHNAVSLQHK
ncbi:hypothetical protein P7K49_012292 [Saguinus oedipus]|uniref:Uncharacterized protein n=1 Tax=Saguinus oedipus TaxID=9490 RepID=A0ABQ9VTU1_SAGOE|nr:hypothetical protein P7K49_012292 [Saguinus oedipus]